MATTFHLATRANIDTIVEFSHCLNQEDPNFTGDVPFNQAAGRGAIAQLADDALLGWLWLICADAVPVGFVALCFGFSLESHGRDAVLDELYLLPEYRGQGIGTATMQFAEAEARRLGAKRIFLEVERSNARAIALYQKLNFEDLGRFFMHKRL